MKLDLTGLRIDVTDGIREFVERKVKKLDKFFDEDTICHVTFTDMVKGKLELNINHVHILQKKIQMIYTMV